MQRQNKKAFDTKRLTSLALLTAVALIIFVVEMQIPNPVNIPGIKLGLANVITVYAVYRCKAPDVFLIVVARVLLGCLLGGSPAALPYSMAGALLCLAGMLVLQHFIDDGHIWIASVFGAIFHNIGQLAVAVLLMGTDVVIGYLPFLIFSGCIAGAFTGLAAQFVIAKIKKTRADVDK